MKKKMIVTGGSGYIASLINKFSQEYEIELLTRKELDLEDEQKVRDYFSKAEFDLVLHAGAIPDTKTCETMPELTYKVNVLSTKAIADACQKRNKRLIFISTEQVFNGRKKGSPFKENDKVHSLSIYGNHKIECENYIQEKLDDYIILRFAWMFGLSFLDIRPSYNLLTKVLNSLFRNNEEYYAVNEVRGFVYSHRLAKKFDDISNLESGLYHVTSDNNLSTYEVALMIGRILNYEDDYIKKFILKDEEKYKSNPRDFHMSGNLLKSKGINFGGVDDNFKECLKEFGWI